MIWTKAMDRMLRVGWGEGRSSQEIAALIGHKLGVRLTSAAVRNRRPDLGLKQRSIDVQVFGGRHKAVASTLKPRTPAPILRLGPDSQPAHWEKRLVGQCAFPVGDGDEGLIACCGPVAPGAKRPYCPFHLELTVGVRHVA
jgi:hypothetical protein